MPVGRSSVNINQEQISKWCLLDIRMSGQGISYLKNGYFKYLHGFVNP